MFRLVDVVAVRSSEKALRYDTWFETPFGRYADEIERRLVFGAVGEVRGLRVLDVGTGTGHYALELARRGARVTGVDPDAGMLALAMQKAKREGLSVRFVRAPAERLPFPSGSFDLVVAVAACEYFREPGRAVAEMRRVLKPDSRLIVGTFNAWSLYAIRARLRAWQNPGSPWAAARFYSPPELLRLFRHVRNWRAGIYALPGLPEVVYTIFARIDRALGLLLRPVGSFLVLESAEE